MSVITPSSNVTLLKCPLEMDNNHQLNFSNKNTQYNYFRGLPKYDVADDFTYIRKDNVIRVEASIDDIMQYNYLMYQNEAYSNKWFYAFITNMEYLNDNCTAIYFKLDVWQTWQFDLDYHKCYVEREHVNDDTIGAHTVPEMLDYGPSFVCTDYNNYFYADPLHGSVTGKEIIAVFQVTSAKFSYNGNNYAFPTPTYSFFNGLPQGCSCFGVLLNKNNSAAIPTIASFYDSCGRGDAIVAITLVPKICCEWDTVEGHNVRDCPFDITYYLPKSSSEATTLNVGFGVSRPSSLDGYTPKNNKMLTSPYVYFYVSNNAGMDVTYRFEDFYFGGNTGFSDPIFAVKGIFEQGGGIYAIPENSKISNESASVGDGYNEGVKGIPLPNISWTSDYYLNWQAVNGKNVAIQTGLDSVGFGLQTIGSLATGASGQPTSGPSVTGFASQIANTAQQMRAAKMVPPQAKGNVNAASFAYSNLECKFTNRVMTIKAEYAKIIDDYLTMYGYKVNSLKVPNITGRSNWNYVKTIDANITGNVPQEDIAEIKGYFDRGITIWHNPNTFLDYNQTNNIV